MNKFDDEHAELRKLFSIAAEDAQVVYAQLLNKVGAQTLTSHEHMSESEALECVHDAIDQIVSTPALYARKEWLKLAVHALGRVSAIDTINGGTQLALGVDNDLHS